ncbi:MAG: diguanylate cyclase [Spirochaetales bacterium]|nr:diguanylate cyclase [Spirochaetales bacterium]
MAREKIPTIALFINWLESNYQYLLLTGMQNAANAMNFNIITFPGGFLYTDQADSLARNFIFDLVSPDSIDGIVFCTPLLGFYSTHEQVVGFINRFSHIPSVSVSAVVGDCPSIITDSATGVRTMLAHLIRDHGLKRIAIIKGPEHLYDSKVRYEAYCQALKENGIVYDPELVLPGNFLEDGGRRAIAMLLDERKVEIDGIFASNDNMARGAIFELISRDIRVPEDIAVVGFDDLEFCQTLNPTITTIVQPMDGLCLKAVQTLAAVIQGKKVPQVTTYPTELRIRHSCGCPNPVPGLTRSQGEKDTSGAAAVSPGTGDSDSIVKEMLEDSASLYKEAASPPVNEIFIKDIFESFLQSVDSDNPSGFYNIIEDKIYQHLVQNNDGTYWQKILSIMQRRSLIHLSGSDRLIKALTFVSDARCILNDLEKRNTLRINNDDRGGLPIYRELTTGALMCRDVQDLLNFISDEIHGFSLQSLYITLYMDQGEDSRQIPPESKLILAYDREKMQKAEVKSFLFPTSHLLPKDLLPENRRHAIILEPLVFKDQKFGLAFFEFIKNTGMYIFFIFRIIMAHIMNALIFTSQLEKSYSDLRSKNLQIGKLSFAVEHSASFITITDTNGVIEYANPKFLSFHGYSFSEVVGKKSNLLKTGNTKREVYEKMWTAIRSGFEWKGEFLNRKKDGSTYWALTVISPIKDEGGAITNFVAIQEDITEFKLKEERLLSQKENLTELANRDGLTGLYNRRYFLEMGERMLAVHLSEKTALSALMLDIDHFKDVNDKYGHESGDTVLKGISRCCLEVLRGHDVIGRYGGEEFAVLLPEVNRASAILIAERIRRRIEEEAYELKGQKLTVTVSIGVVETADPKPTLSVILDRADTALYKAKHLGRNRVEVFNEK